MDAVKTIFAFLAGAAAGTVAALLMAPDSGENTRARIRAKATGAVDRAKAAVDIAKDKVQEGLDELETALEKE